MCDKVIKYKKWNRMIALYSIKWKHIPLTIFWRINQNVYVCAEWYAWWPSSGLKNSLFLLTMIIKLEMHIDRANKYIHIIKDNDRNLITEEDYVWLADELVMSSLSILFEIFIIINAVIIFCIDVMFSHSNIKGKCR
jgi:hypothetical protein